ncbi:bifunctional hydroxymethylpyrimidine kinase/phosphomethylpyrimidine kinase [Nitrososphaera sp.]|uniref:bifunctional hydroxymethylpyrimidine kinase/phosphomethylpyrimidine kinase n=1 Tax=Nitrososphaera sp. TaxID=1971748 RepID=UPI002ED77F14
MKVALSVAGSDSGAAAGVQADLKTFSALGVYGCIAITAITAQNTRKVSGVFEVPVDAIKAQVRAVMSDSPPDAIKVGMVYSIEIIEAVTGMLAGAKVPIVLDPILAAGTGYGLMQKNALEHFIKKVLPICTLVTPNRMEAEKLSGVKIRDDGDVIRAAKRIRSLGAQNVIVKGGHAGKNVVTDILLEKSDKLIRMSNPRINIKETHGSGCNFSAAATAYLARGFDVAEACDRANEYVHNAIKGAVTFGRGLPVTNPLSSIYRDAQRYATLVELQQAVDRLEALQGFGRLIPETATNFAYAVLDAEGPTDVAAVRGRIVKAGDASVPVSRVEFGASRHMASAVVAFMKVKPATRSVINIRYESKLVEVCRSLFSVSSYDRSKEPIGTRRKEDSSVSWGTSVALAKNPAADVIYHKGAIGKEPMITVFGKNPGDVLLKIEKILKAYR